ncbi:hypothetical protein EX30DRAFT_366937 [Ascodesmis nigricans]|uniref:Uncharacterized protein n=1 Tax=Ascodesmis nigricans TaxID=341454 RepID=A0A4S2MR54_9PEZI|nr:hypothetical protein EX30DRAFT_366937 [Ascodesmis nigricans]
MPSILQPGFEAHTGSIVLICIRNRGDLTVPSEHAKLVVPTIFILHHNSASIASELARIPTTLRIEGRRGGVRFLPSSTSVPYSTNRDFHDSVSMGASIEMSGVLHRTGTMGWKNYGVVLLLEQRVGSPWCHLSNNTSSHIVQGIAPIYPRKPTLYLLTGAPQSTTGAASTLTKAISGSNLVS